MNKVMSMVLVVVLLIGMGTFVVSAAEPYELTQDFSTNVLDENVWGISSPEAEGIKAADGMLKLNKIGFGYYAEIKQDLTDFALQFEVSGCTTDWLGLSFQAKRDLQYNAGGYLMMLKNDANLLLSMPSEAVIPVKASEIESAWAGSNIVWTAGNDNLIDAAYAADPTATPKILTYKVVVKGNTLKLYLKNNLDSQEVQDDKFSKSLGEWEITPGTGVIHFCSGSAAATLNIDNIKLSSNPDADFSATPKTEDTNTETTPVDNSNASNETTTTENPKTADNFPMAYLLLPAACLTVLLVSRKKVRA